MFKHWSKRTQVTAGLIAGLLIMAIGLGIYGIRTGRISASAMIYYHRSPSPTRTPTPTKTPTPAPTSSSALGTIYGDITRYNQYCPPPGGKMVAHNKEKNVTYTSDVTGTSTPYHYAISSLPPGSYWVYHTGGDGVCWTTTDNITTAYAFCGLDPGSAVISVNGNKASQNFNYVAQSGTIWVKVGHTVYNNLPEPGTGPALGAKVYISGREYSVNSAGNQIQWLAKGSYDIKVIFNGQTQTKSATIDNCQNTMVNFFFNS